jgi:ATP-dependent DNA helicase DinG
MNEHISPPTPSDGPAPDQPAHEKLHEKQGVVDEPVYLDLDDTAHRTLDDLLAESDVPYGDRPDPAAAMTELTETDLKSFFGPEGPLARRLEGYESRPSQLAMAEAVKRALLAGEHALIEAPTGTGKSIAYLVPAILAGKTIVVATANKSLQSQLFQKDIPFLRTVLDQPVSAVVVKGRSNFVCTYKWEKEAPVQDRLALYDRENEQIVFLKQWLTETETGDVDDLPFMLAGDLRPRIVSFTDDCLQRDCRHFTDNCWVNRMRDQAAQAQIIVTNHHLLLNALELGFAGERILPPADVYIVDEAHQLEDTATAVFETVVTDFTVEQLLRRNQLGQYVDEDELDEIRFQNTLAFQSVSNLDRSNSFRLEGDLEEISTLGRRMEELGKRLRLLDPYKQVDEDSDEQIAERRAYELLVEMLNSTGAKLRTVATSRHDGEMVRYAVRVFDRRHVSLELHAAPITPGELIARYLFHPEEPDGEARPRTVICTSATLATDGQFAHFKQRCGIQETGEEQVLPAVFDYPTQALLYQPALPAYNYQNPGVYYDAIAQEIERLIEVSRGRALCLFTSWSGLQQVEHRLRQGDRPVIWPVRAQGDAPRDALLTWFKETPHSVLLATRSFWEGVDIPGDDLSLVVMDKLPFPTPGDPLHAARMENIESAGDNSFGGYMAPLMTLALKQGFGRLIRRTSDRGVVAILDERLTSRAYGRRARRDLPPARYSRAFRDVHKFFQRALESEADFALNVWGETLGDEPGVGWRWQLLRLQDGKADGEHGVLVECDDPVEGEIHAATVGLANLRERIEKAGREPREFGVELRVSPAGRSRLASEPTAPYSAEAAAWKTATLLAALPIE